MTVGSLSSPFHRFPDVFLSGEARKGRHSLAYGERSCEKIAALPPDVRKGFPAFPYTGLNTKAFRLGRLPESRRLSAHRAAQPQ
jgi:hypothetical protein